MAAGLRGSLAHHQPTRAAAALLGPGPRRESLPVAAAPPGAGPTIGGPRPAPGCRGARPRGRTACRRGPGGHCARRAGHARKRWLPCLPARAGQAPDSEGPPGSNLGAITNSKAESPGRLARSRCTRLAAPRLARRCRMRMSLASPALPRSSRRISSYHFESWPRDVASSRASARRAPRNAAESKRHCLPTAAGKGG